MSIASLEGPGARRVLMVIESLFPSPGSGGAEGQVLTLARHFRRRGLDVVVVAPRLPAGPQALEDRVDGVPVIRIAYPRLRWLGGAVLQVKLALLLLLHRGTYAVIHAHIANTMAATCSVLGRLLGRPVVVKLTGALELNQGILDPGVTAAGTRFLRWALRRATHYHAVSSRIARLLPAAGFDAARVRLVANAVDTERYRPLAGKSDLRRQLGLDDQRVGLFVGRLTREKALDLLLRAWAHAFHSRDDATLLLLGDGDLIESLRALAASLGIAERVRFLGAHADVRPYLEAADFAVLTSSFEGLSNALLEYMAAGLAVVGSRVSGTEDFVEPGKTGWLFDSGDEPGLTRCLGEVAHTPRETLREMGRAGRLLVEERAAIPFVAETLAELYGLALDPRPPAMPL